jgi:UDP-N-acetylglucosamine 2-epimerase (non-hydrolysing)
VKIATICGTRPEIIRLSRVIDLLDSHCDHKLVYTGQNHDPNLSTIFFEELGVRKPDVWWNVQGRHFGEQAGKIISESVDYLSLEKPDRVLILGDTNSGLAAIAAARLGIPVYHMEAGNRCFDNRVPEEVNRRVIDHSSEVLLPYTHRSKENLLAEGIHRDRIYVTGNPIFEVISHYMPAIESSKVLETLEIDPQGYFAVTLHRSENVDNECRLGLLLSGLDLVAEHFKRPVIASLHPRTADKIQKFDLAPKSSLVRFVTPMGFHDFVKLEKNAFAVLTDSGTVQEEAAILRTPNVIVRDVTERAEAIEAGSGILSGAEPETLLRAVRFAVESGNDWTLPDEYLQPNVASIVSRIVLGYRHSRTLAA